MKTYLIFAVGLISLATANISEAQDRSRLLRGRGRVDQLLENRSSDRQPKERNTRNNSQSTRNPSQPKQERRDPNDPQFQPKPDLVAVYVIDEGNTAKIFVQNRGKVRSGATTMRLLISPLGGGSTTVRSFQLAPLDPGGSKILSVRGLSLSNVSLFVHVDFGNKVAESDESNNTARHKVEDQITGAADLALTKMQFFPEKKEVWVTLRNNGRKNVRRTTIRLESKFGLGTNEKMRYTVKDLKPGTFQIFRFFPKQMLRGTQFDATVDLNNDVPETNERNNRLVRTF